MTTKVSIEPPKGYEALFLELNPQQKRLFDVLYKAKGEIVVYDNLALSVFYDKIARRASLKALVSSLRKRLEKHNPKVTIVNSPETGYAINISE